MKKLLFVLVVFLGLVGCGNNQRAGSAGEVAGNDAPKDGVEVLYFHGKQRCITCNAIEKLTQEVVEQNFAQPLNEGKITFQSIDLSTPEGEKLADKYEVTWSSLFINQWQNGKETRNNFTDFGFSHAKGSPEVFKAGVKKKIEELLN